MSNLFKTVKISRVTAKNTRKSLSIITQEAQSVALLSPIPRPENDEQGWQLILVPLPVWYPTSRAAEPFLLEFPI